MVDVYHRLALPHGMTLTVQWIVEADWDRHWAVVLISADHRDDLARCCTFTDAKTLAREILRAALTREEVSA